MLAKIVKKLAESLTTSEGLLQSLMESLDQAGVVNQLDPKQSQDQLAASLLSLVQENPRLLPKNELRAAMKLPESEQGPWALEKLNSALSNNSSE